MSDFYKMIETPFDRAVDRAIEEHNDAFLADPDAVRKAKEDATRWASILRAREEVSTHGVVIPMGLAEAILDVLEGRDSMLSAFSQTLPARMLAAAITEAKG